MAFLDHSPEATFARKYPLVPQAPVTLGFDPAGLTDPILVAVFQDRVARNLWIGVKWQHIVSQYFNEDCLMLARAIQKKRPPTVAELTKLLNSGRDPIFSCRVDAGQTMALAEALFPYVCGDKDFAYVVKLDG